ncbi:MAG: sigma-70 family RNA polymerase sigma factor [Ruminococcus sp.]|nr:sigma-70 family RNA polymerase sigma factor [Ruminococcus sp.]
MERTIVAKAYDRYAQTVVRAAWHYTGNVQAAQDCAQEAFLKLLQHEDMTDEHILPWLIRTAVNAAKDITKSAANNMTVPLENAEYKVSENSEQQMCERAAMRAILSLDEQYRLPLYLHIAEERTIREISKIIGRNFNTTASLIRRGKKLLQKAYRKEEL